MIPVCRSEFLQDVTIALGRRSLKSLRHRNAALHFAVSEEEVNGEPHERLDIEVRTRSGASTNITIWQDGVTWVHSRLREGLPTRTAFETHANLAGMDYAEVASLIRATLCDLESVQHIWKEHAIPS